MNWMQVAEHLNAPRTWRAVQAVDPVGSHASWIENLPRNRVAPTPASRRPGA